MCYTMPKRRDNMRQNISLTLDDEIIEIVDKMAIEENRSRSNMIEILLKKQLKREKQLHQE